MAIRTKHRISSAMEQGRSSSTCSTAAPAACRNCTCTEPPPSRPALPIRLQRRAPRPRNDVVFQQQDAISQGLGLRKAVRDVQRGDARQPLHRRRRRVYISARVSSSRAARRPSSSNRAAQTTAPPRQRMGFAAAQAVRLAVEQSAQAKHLAQFADSPADRVAIQAAPRPARRRGGRAPVREGNRARSCGAGLHRRRGRPA